MRGVVLVLVSLVALALAGCAEGPKDGPRFSNACQRTLSMGRDFVDGAFFPGDGTDQRDDVFGRNATHEDGRPLAALVLNLHPDTLGATPRTQGIAVLDGRLHLRFEDADTGETVRSYRDGALGELETSWTFESTGKAYSLRNATFTVPMDLEGEAQPFVVRAVWSFERDLDGDPDTPSAASMRFSAQRWYQDCPA